MPLRMWCLGVLAIFSVLSASHLQSSECSTGESGHDCNALYSESSPILYMACIWCLRYACCSEPSHLCSIHGKCAHSCGYCTAESENIPDTTKLQRQWSEAAAALLGTVGPRQQLTSAFSDALATRAGDYPPRSNSRLIILMLLLQCC